MHPLAFQITWLLGAASAGDKEARAALNMAYPALVADVSWDLEMIRTGVVKSQPRDIDDGLQKMMKGFAKNAGETCTQAIIRSMKLATGEYAARVVASAATTLPKDKLIEQMENILAVLKSNGDGK